MSCYIAQFPNNASAITSSKTFNNFSILVAKYLFYGILNNFSKSLRYE